MPPKKHAKKAIKKKPGKKITKKRAKPPVKKTKAKVKKARIIKKPKKQEEVKQEHKYEPHIRPKPKKRVRFGPPQIAPSVYIEEEQDKDVVPMIVPSVYAPERPPGPYIEEDEDEKVVPVVVPSIFPEGRTPSRFELDLRKKRGKLLDKDGVAHNLQPIEFPWTLYLPLRTTVKDIKQPRSKTWITFPPQVSMEGLTEDDQEQLEAERRPLPNDRVPDEWLDALDIHQSFIPDSNGQIYKIPIYDGKRLTKAVTQKLDRQPIAFVTALRLAVTWKHAEETKNVSAHRVTTDLKQYHMDNFVWNNLRVIANAVAEDTLEAKHLYLLESPKHRAEMEDRSLLSGLLYLYGTWFYPMKVLTPGGTYETAYSSTGLLLLLQAVQQSFPMRRQELEKVKALIRLI